MFVFASFHHHHISDDRYPGPISGPLRDRWLGLDSRHFLASFLAGFSWKQSEGGRRQEDCNQGGREGGRDFSIWLCTYGSRREGGPILLERQRDGDEDAAYIELQRKEENERLHQECISNGLAQSKFIQDDQAILLFALHAPEPLFLRALHQESTFPELLYPQSYISF